MATSESVLTQASQDDPLAESVRQMLDQRWKARYGEFTLERALTASSAIIKRLYRERTLGHQGKELGYQFQYCPPSEVHARLSVCKPVAWRGRGELPQYSWSSMGTWIVVDLWSGIGGTIMACLALGLRIFAVAIEQDAVAAERAVQSFPSLVSMQYVEDFKGEMLVDFLQRRTVEGVRIGGGSPCQGNSALNHHRRGLGDVRSHQPLQLARIAEEIANLDVARGLRIRTFLENVQLTKVSHQALQPAPRGKTAQDSGLPVWLGASQSLVLVGCKGGLLSGSMACGCWSQRDRRLLGPHH